MICCSTKDDTDGDEEQADYIKYVFSIPVDTETNCTDFFS